MNTFIIFLRGVTPTGKNKVPMADLRTALTGAGFQNVRTWIQSGNALVTTPLSREEVILLVHDTIQSDIGPDLSIIVKTADEVRRILNENPLAHQPQERIFYVLANERFIEEVYAEIADQNFGEEQLAFTSHAAYMYIPGSAARSKLSGAFLERKLKMRLTVRNGRTLGKMVEMVRS